MGEWADLRVRVEGLVIVIWPHSLVAHCARGAACECQSIWNENGNSCCFAFRVLG